MFAQKKKKSKIWIVIPVVLALGIGLWLNAGLNEDAGEESIPAGSDQYEEDISDLAGLRDTSSDADSSARTEGESSAGSETADDSRYNPDSGNLSEGTGSAYSRDDFDESDGDENERGGTESGRQEEENTDSASGDSDKKYAGKILVIAGSDGSISVLRYDKNGNVISRDKTAIDLSMLTETDQKLFGKGITLNDEFELSELLQDFEG